MSPQEPKPSGEKSPAKTAEASKALPPGLKILIHRLIETCSFFSNMDAAEVESFLHQCKSESAEPGEMIFRKGDEGNDMYVIVSGEVIVLSGGDEEHNLRLRKGDVFGEIALIEGIPRSAGVRAEAKTSLLTVSRGILETNAPLLRAKVLANVAHQIASSLLKADEEINRLRAEVKRLSAGAT
jgi:CRP-like cAMP-binding protein